MVKHPLRTDNGKEVGWYDPETDTFAYTGDNPTVEGILERVGGLTEVETSAPTPAKSGENNSTEGGKYPSEALAEITDGPVREEWNTPEPEQQITIANTLLSSYGVEITPPKRTTR